MAEPTVLHLSIGEVLGLLLAEFPDVTISKIRFLESQGLIEPERTPSGYRKFYDADVELLRLILREQREHFLPLRVIKDRIDSGEIETTGNTPPRGTASPHPADYYDEQPSPAAVAKHPAAGRGSVSPNSLGLGITARQNAGNGASSGGAGGRRAAEQLAPTPASMPRPAVETSPAVASSPRLLPGVVVNRDELCAMASVTLTQLKSLEEYGVVSPRKGAGDLYGDEAVEIASAAGGFLRAGVDARHLRAWRTSVEREVGLYEQLIVPLLRQRHPQARAQAMEQLEDLNGLGAKLRNALMRSAVRQHLDL
ncbi:MAG: MerR family transcriptional regulator [Actinomycetota bacterium]|nr:MerR family transcriptional regulator [Actinomycetota bacterium]